MKLAVLDDYQNVALRSADWPSLKGVAVTVFPEAFASVDEAARELAPFDILCLMRERTAFPRELISRLPNLKFISLTGHRAPSMDMQALAERSIPVSHTRGGYGLPATAELAWGLIIIAARDLEKAQGNMRGGRWHDGLAEGSLLEGKRLGIIGLGKLGGRVAKVGQAFGMDVVAWSQNLTEERAREAGVTLVAKETLLETSDVISIHLVLSDRTRGLLGKTDLEKTKPTAILVNTSRGPIIDEKALLEGLRKGRPGHAALDVYDREPLPADHPLRKLPNVTLSPHLGYVSAENHRVFYEDTVANVRGFLAGKPERLLK